MIKYAHLSGFYLFYSLKKLIVSSGELGREIMYVSVVEGKCIFYSIILEPSISIEFFRRHRPFWLLRHFWPTYTFWVKSTKRYVVTLRGAKAIDLRPSASNLYTKSKIHKIVFSNTYPRIGTTKGTANYYTILYNSA